MPDIKPHAQNDVKDISARSARKTRKTVNAQNVAETVMSRTRQRRPVRERYAALMSFVAFARGEDVDFMVVPPRLASALRSPEIREGIDAILRQVASAANSGSKASDGLPPTRDIKLPAPPADILRMIGPRPVLIRAHNALTDLVEYLVRTLDETDDLSRLKVCPICETLFVALNEQSQACAPRCSNTLRQRNFWARAEEKKAALAAEYRERAAVNRAQREQKRRLHIMTVPLRRPK
jgi:hypothetical protein